MNGNKMKVVAGYVLQEKLGSGSFAVVYKGIRLESTNDPNTPSHDNDGGAKLNIAEVVAIKAIARNSDKLTAKVLHNLEKEISILRTYRHRNIVCLHEVQKTTNHFYLILEYCSGGDLQHLIRERKAGRLSEPLCRRLMRDLCGGLAFLNRYQLIHRDIKPQNLLLTGSLPLDEVNDPCRTEELEFQRQSSNFPSSQFVLKIADFGFARHLQTTSLAETLCGSPLYMAPEILSHQRYDEKADLWSVGTVLFEMISGKPPFNGDNHIHLLQNIQKNAVRLPPGVRVSKECVQLLRILLNRNPNGRATFREFKTACDSFIALGCNGIATQDEGFAATPGSTRRTNPQTAMAVSDSLMTVDEEPTTRNVGNNHAALQNPNIVSPQFKSAVPPMTVSSSALPGLADGGNTMLRPLVATPPSTSQTTYTIGDKTYVYSITNPTQIGVASIPSSAGRSEAQTADSGSLQNSLDEFVMVEYQGSSVLKNTGATTADSPWNKNEGIVCTSKKYQNYCSNTPQDSNCGNYIQQHPLPTSGFLLSRIGNYPILTQPGGFLVSKEQKNRGMLSTSPGTGGALMGMLSARTGVTGTSQADLWTNSLQVPDGAAKQLDVQISRATKMLAASEDVGRRAVTVAHLGDNLAMHGIRLLMVMDSESPSVLSSSPMEGIDLEYNTQTGNRINDSNSGVTGSRGVAPIDGSGSTAFVTGGARFRRQRSSFSEKRMSLTSGSSIDENEIEEMPFALQSESPPLLSAGIPTRSVSINKGTRQRQPMKPTPSMIKANFCEALLCYVKALNMLKSAFAAVEGVSSETDNLLKIAASHHQKFFSSDKINHLQAIKSRCEVSKEWLGAQFNGVLERGDAANTEIRKFAPSSVNATSNTSNETTSQSAVVPAAVPVVSSVEELIYNHALSLGREGAVKQLLGQNEQARACYRSAGLLAETLLMDSKNVVGDDRKILEGYVDAFATQINELDTAIMQQKQQAQNQ